MSPLSSFLAGPFGAIAGGVAFVCGFVFTALKFGAWWHDRKLSMQQADEDRQLFLLKELVALDERRLEQMATFVGGSSRGDFTASSSN